MIKSVIFDFDMTLVDSLQVGNKALEDLETNNGISSKGVSQKEVWGNTHEILAQKLAKLNNNKLSWQEISRLDVDYMQKNYVNCKLNEIKFLKELNENNIPLGIISNNSLSVIHRVLKNEQNNSIKFEIVFGSEDLLEGKTKSDLLIECINMLKLKPTEMIYVGDHVNDIICAKNANVISAAVASGLHTMDELKKENPDILLSKLSELRTHIFQS